MKLLTIDPFKFNKGLRFAEIVDFSYPPDDYNRLVEKFVNNDFDLSEIDKNESEKLSRLLFFLEYSASVRELKYNPHFDSKYNFDNIITYKFEEILTCKFFVFFINILNSLGLSYSDSADSSDFYLGKLDKLSDKDKFRRKRLTIIQKYVIIAQLLDCFLSEIKIKDKTSFNIAFHYIAMRFIDKSEAEANFLNDSEETGILVSRGSIFLTREKFRTPVSSSQLQNIYVKIKNLYQDPEPLEELYGIKANERFLESRKPHKRSNKIWDKSFFLENIIKYKNQSEMAKALGVSRQRISAMKKKLKIDKISLT